MPTNDFVPFCPTDTGTNLLSQSAYLASPYLPVGNQPGVASSKLNNKALRQSSFITSQVAQLIANLTNTNVNDDGNTANFFAQLSAVLQPIAPSVQKFTTATSGTYQLPVLFFIASGNATAGATYTNNGATFTVAATIAAGTLLKTNASGAPTLTGTLTKSGGTGDATITFYAIRVPLSIRVRAVGGGGGGMGTGNTNTGGAGGNGGDTTFGSTLIVAGKGSGAGGAGSGGGAGGSASLGTGPVGIALPGGNGSSNSLTATASGYVPGGVGGSSPFGGAGTSGSFSLPGGSAVPNTGSGGGGATTNNTTGAYSGNGGGAGGYVDALIFSPSFSYGWTVGAGGIAGTAGSGVGAAGGVGGSGLIIVEEYYQ